MNEQHKIAIPVPTSFDLEYNRRSWPMYAAAVREAGGSPVEVSLHGLSPAQVSQIARECGGVLLPGSPADVDPRLYGRERLPECAPADDGRETVDRLLLEECFASGKPVFGICYGVQSLNVWRGGTLIQHLVGQPVNHSAGAAVAVGHPVSVSADSRLGGLMSGGEAVFDTGGVRLPVNSSHHQAVELVGEGLRVVAVSTIDGVVEAIEGSGADGEPEFVLGVQWHPERSVAMSATSRALFRAFLAAVDRWESRAEPAEAR